MKMIKDQIAKMVLLSTVVTAVVIGIVSIIMMFTTAISFSKTTVLQTANSAATSANSSLGTYTAAMTEMAGNAILANSHTSSIAKREFLDTKVAELYEIWKLFRCKWC